MKIFCCQCAKNVDARLTDGAEIYPHRPDLHALPFWKCDACKNYVGCHHRTTERTRPLGVIPTKEIKSARKQIHKLLDPIWERGKMKRGQVYKRISDALGYEFHTAEIRSVEEAQKITQIVKRIVA